MSRIKRYCRRLSDKRQFKPQGIPSTRLETIQMKLDEFEAVRLVDLEGKSQIEAATEMQVSRATIQRLLEKARRKHVEAVLYNKILEVSNEIGNIKLKGENNLDIESKELIHIAFPTNDKLTINKHFGKSDIFALYTIKDNEVIAINHLLPPPHEEGVIPRFLGNHDVDVVITTNMGLKAIKRFSQAGIDIILGAKGRIDVNLNEYLGGFLQSREAFCETENK